MDSESEKLGTALRRLEDENQDLRSQLAMARQEVERLEALADEDVLVPVLNRRAFMGAFMRMKAFDERYGLPLSLLYLDLNGFKSVNDRLGHAAGDAVLRHVGELLVKQVRKSDFIGRLGGDEFGIVLANSEIDFAKVKAAQLAAAIQEQPTKFEGMDLPVAAAYGVIQVRKDEGVEDALARADKEMYRYKHT
jgi:diguanylate cyclase (GGDEF)-like protein